MTRVLSRAIDTSTGRVRDGRSLTAATSIVSRVVAAVPSASKAVIPSVKVPELSGGAQALSSPVVAENEVDSPVEGTKVHCIPEKGVSTSVTCTVRSTIMVSSSSIVRRPRGVSTGRSLTLLIVSIALSDATAPKASSAVIRRVSGPK